MFDVKDLVFFRPLCPRAIWRLRWRYRTSKVFGSMAEHMARKTSDSGSVLWERWGPPLEWWPRVRLLPRICFVSTYCFKTWNRSGCQHETLQQRRLGNVPRATSKPGELCGIWEIYWLIPSYYRVSTPGRSETPDLNLAIALCSNYADMVTWLYCKIGEWNYSWAHWISCIVVYKLPWKWFKLCEDFKTFIKSLEWK